MINLKGDKFMDKKLQYNVQEVIDYMKKTQFPGYKGTLKLFYGTSE